MGILLKTQQTCMKMSKQEFDAAFEDYPSGICNWKMIVWNKNAIDPWTRWFKYGFAVNKGMKSWVAWKLFVPGLINIKANGTYHRILDTYIVKMLYLQASDIGFFWFN